MTAHRKAFICSSLLFVVVSVVAVSAQNVPATAREAAKLPQYASRLAHAAATAQQGSPAPATAQHRAAMGGRSERSGLMSAFERSYLPPDTLYSNGAINGTTDAWTINFGFVITDSFPANASAQVTGLSFGAWLFPGDVLQSVEVLIGSSAFSGDISDQVLSFTQSNCSNNQYGFNVCVESGNLAAVNLNGGTYWVSLQNAVVNTGNPVYWDENSGPSMAAENSVGTIPSEAFTLTGVGAHEQRCLTSQGPLQIIHSFTQQEGAPNGVVIDAAGNLYGTNPFGGDDSQGFAYKLNRFADWLLDPLFNFLGGSSGYQPNGVIVGPNGTLYGGAQGGIQNCGSDGSQYCGLVYNLTPQPTACANATCDWREKVLYRFSSKNDGWGVSVSAYDRNGNLYGVTGSGGAFDAGTVFELTPSGGGWTKNTLYSFTGRFDGGDPNTVVVGTDGNLYGTTYTGGILNQGVVFQLTPSGGGWTESVIQQFPQYTLSMPRYLVQDNLGNLYGILGIGSDASIYPPTIFRLQKDGSGWDYSEKFVHEDYVGILSNLTIDAGGNLYGTGGYGYLLAYELGAYIFKASYDSRGWHYQDLEIVDNPDFRFGGSLATDSSGNLYGTTGGCGTYNVGTLWQLSP